MAFGLYEHSAVYDKWIHLVAFGGIAAIVRQAIGRYCVRRGIAAPARFLHLVVLACALSLGTVWELFEFSIDRFGWFTAQRGLEDTMVDLVADLCGALLALAAKGVWRTGDDANPRIPSTATRGEHTRIR